MRAPSEQKSDTRCGADSIAVLRRSSPLCAGSSLFAWVLMAGCSALQPHSATRSAGSQSGEEPAASTTPATEVLQNSPIKYAATPSEAAPLPAYLTGPLPRDLAEFSRFRDGDPAFRDLRVVEDLACVGDQPLLEELASAILAAARAGASPADLGNSYGQLFAGCQEQGACAWARQHLAGADREELRSVAYWALVPCSGEEADALFEAPAVPDRPLVERHFRSVASLSYSSVLERAVSHVVRTGTLDDARRAALVLGNAQDPRSTTLLLKLMAETSDPERAVAIGLALGRKSEPGAQAAFRWACEEQPSHLLCIPNISSATPADTSDETPLDVTELRRCVEERESTSRMRYDCFEQLAHLDRSIAADIACAHASQDLTASPDPWMGELATAVVRFPTTEALRRHLIVRGLLEEASDAPPKARTARSLLLAEGKVLGVNAHETSVKYDFLLRRLAKAVGPSLAGVVFEQEPDPAASKPKAYLIRAYVGGRRWSERPKPGTCHDMGAMARLLNAVLRDLDQEPRFIPLDTNDEVLWAAYGSESGLSELIDEGLLRPGTGLHLHDDDGGATHGEVYELPSEYPSRCNPSASRSAGRPFP